MSYHTFGPGLALDHVTMKGIPAMIGYLEDADTGEPVQAYTLEAEPVETSIITNRYGYFPQFYVPDTVARLRLRFGTVEMIHGAWELIFQASEDASTAAIQAQAAAQAAEDAAALIGAPVDEVLAHLFANEDTETYKALDRLYGDRHGRTWVQSSTPPAGDTYEWVGVANNSASIKKIDGVEVARNYIISEAISAGFTTSNVSIAHDSHELVNLITTTGTGAPYVGLASLRVPVIEGQYMASAARFEWGEGIGRIRHQVQFRGPNNESISAPHDFIDKSVVPDGGVTLASHLVPSGAAEARIYFWFYLESTTNAAPAGSTIRLGKWRASVANTEASAKAQVDYHFTGDTPDDRAQDIWYNTGSNDAKRKWNNTTKTWVPVAQPSIDSQVQPLITAPSTTRTALDSRYGNSAVAGYLTNSGATKTALDARFTTADALELERLRKERHLASQTDLVQLLADRSNLGHLEIVVTGTLPYPAFSVHRTYDGGSSGFYAETSFAGTGLSSNDQYYRIWENKAGDSDPGAGPGQFIYNHRHLLSPVSNHEFALKIKPATHPAQATQWVPRHNNIDTAFRAADPLFMTPDGRLRVLEGDVTRAAINGHLDIIQNVYGRHTATGSTNLIQIWTTHRFYPNGVIHISGRWKALQDIIMDSGYVMMMPGNPAHVQRVVTSLGNVYTSDPAKYGGPDEYMTAEGDDAISYAFVMSGTSNFAAAVTYDNVHETLWHDQPNKPVDPAFIEHRNSTIIKVYNNLVNGETLIPAGTVHRFSGRYIQAYSPSLNDTIDLV